MGRMFVKRATRRLGHALGAITLGVIVALTSACGTSSLPAGVYTNHQYGFSITYPAGWQPNITSQPGAPAPLIVVITRTGARPTAGATVISSLTVDVLAVSDIGGPSAAASLAQNKSLIPTTIAGLPAYQDHATSQQGKGNTSYYTVSHTDYYIVHGAYEYQIGVDALAGDSAALASMVRSFTFI